MWNSICKHILQRPTKTTVKNFVFTILVLANIIIRSLWACYWWSLDIIMAMADRHYKEKHFKGQNKFASKIKIQGVSPAVIWNFCQKLKTNPSKKLGLKLKKPQGASQTFVFEEPIALALLPRSWGCFQVRDRQRSSAIITVYFIYNTKADFTPVVVTLCATINKRNIER